MIYKTASGSVYVEKGGTYYLNSHDSPDMNFISKVVGFVPGKNCTTSEIEVESLGKSWKEGHRNLKLTEDGYITGLRGEGNTGDVIVAMNPNSEGKLWVMDEKGVKILCCGGIYNPPDNVPECYERLSKPIVEISP